MRVRFRMQFRLLTGSVDVVVVAFLYRKWMQGQELTIGDGLAPLWNRSKVNKVEEKSRKPVQHNNPCTQRKKIRSFLLLPDTPSWIRRDFSMMAVSSVFAPWFSSSGREPPMWKGWWKVVVVVCFGRMAWVIMGKMYCIIQKTCRRTETVVGIGT
jgi:hypothetical protein